MNFKEITINKLKNRINDEIKSRQIRLIDEKGKQIGIISLEEGLKMAKELNLDLVEIQPKINPPVVKLMDYGKFKFEINKKKSNIKKKQKEIKIKEIKFRPNTGANDYLIKLKNIKKFLTEGNKVKITICFKGREIIHKKNGLELIKKICDELDDIGKIESIPKFEGKNIIAIISSKK
ncbi:MAG TPA: translation initiation factor IF-3 [Candidatus Azoamicus sp.]